MKILAAILLLALVLAGCQPFAAEQGAEAARVIRIATDLHRDSAGYAQLEDFGRRLTQSSEGRMTIKLYASGAWSEDDSLLDYAALETLEMVVLSAQSLTSLEAAYEIFALPYLFYDESQVATYALGAQGQKALALLEDTAYRGVGFVGDGYYYFLQGKGPLGESGTWSGLTMRGAANTFYADALRYLGITLTDGAEGSFFDSYLADEAEVKSLISRQVVNESYYLNDPEMFYHLEIALCHGDWWQSLSDDERTLITTALNDSLREQLTWQQSAPLEMVFPDGGVTMDAVSAAQKTNLYYASRSVFNNYLATTTNPLAAYWRSGQAQEQEE